MRVSYDMENKMSTEIIEPEDGFTATIFYGGVLRGKCLQINQGGQYVVLESRQFWLLVRAVLNYWFQL